MAEAKELVQKRRAGGGHRGRITKILPTVQGLTENFQEENRQEVKKFYFELKEKLETLHKLDEQILDLVSETAKEDAEVEKEVEEASKYKQDLFKAIIAFEEVLNKTKKEPVEVNEPTPAQAEKSVRVKLPKLDPKTFDGKAYEWQEFWDCFESSVHTNKQLSDVDKFAYLRSMVKGAAKSTISGFSLTSGNYGAAVELLKKRFANTNKIKVAHINELMNLNPVFHKDDTERLRTLYDLTETHYRGLTALEIDQETYSCVIVPKLLEKIPAGVRLNMTRGSEDYEDLNLENLLKALLKEIELRECTSQMFENRNSTGTSVGNHKFKRGSGKPGGQATTSVLLSRKTESRVVKCVFCMGNHPHSDCRKVVSVPERKALFRKYARCFICTNKGHLARDCRSNRLCEHCGGRHHISICEGQGSHAREAEGKSTTVEPSVPPKQESPVTVGVQNHVGAGGRVALQTAKGIVHGERDLKIRVLFDSGAQRSFITNTAKQIAGLSVKRKEWVEIATFGQTKRKGELLEVVEVDVSPMGKGKSVKFEAYVVPDISKVRNEHIEVVKADYPHLKEIWFSDVSKGEETLNIDALVGSDYLWNFQEGETIRGEEEHDPVAVKTKLHWVLSGPLKGKTEVGTVKVNLNVSRCVPHSVGGSILDGEVKRLWDLETLGIREEEESMYEPLFDNISFNGTRYSVQLPWKEGHGELPSNYATSKTRLKSLLGRLRNEPEILREYDKVIREQLKAGVIERVYQSDEGGKVHYLPHQAVIRKEAETTKLRVVFDAPSKEGKKGTSLNDCLHVGPPLPPLLYDILLKFRENRIGIVADIEKAFLNIEVDEKDRDCLRFLWVEDPFDDNSRIVIFRFCRVVFGINCSPFLLNGTLRTHLQKYKHDDP